MPKKTNKNLSAKPIIGKEQNMKILTRDNLQSYIHSIHNFLRNSGVGFGKEALRIFNVFYGLKLIQPHLDKFNLNKDEKKNINFDELVKIVNKQNKIDMATYLDEKLLETLHNLKYDETDETKQNLGFFLFHQIPTDIKSSVWEKLIGMINNLPIGYDNNNNVNLSGKVYEYFIGRDKEAIKELGAFFTDRHITEKIFDILSIKLKEDGLIPTIIDPFGGSGGFTLGIVDYLKKKNSNIDWSKNVDRIYHFDMDQGVISMAGLEMFALTGYFPKRINNYNRINSFTNEFMDGTNSLKYDYIITNPPYGGDEIEKSPDQIERDILINYIKENNKDSYNKNEQYIQLMKETKEYNDEQHLLKVNYDTCSERIRNFAKKHNINNANDKEACSLILLADLLKENGICCGVLKDGVFFNPKYSYLRQIILENYNITDIISIPQDEFENTGTKTSIIIFHNNGKTKKINFSEIEVLKNTETIVSKTKEGIYKVDKIKDIIEKVNLKYICSATLKEIIDSKNKDKLIYSWNYKDYNEYKVECPNNYKLVKLDSLCKINPKSKASYKKDDNVQYIEISDIEKNQIINSTQYKYSDLPKGTKRIPDLNEILICSVRPNSNKIVYINKHNIKKDWLMTHAIFNLKCNDILTGLYLYNYLIYKLDAFLKYRGDGSNYPRISPDIVSNIKIPIPNDITKFKKILEELNTLNENLTVNNRIIYQNKLKELFIDFNHKYVESDKEPEFNKVSFKDIEYILEDNIMYKIKEDETRGLSKGPKFGTWNDGKVKKYVVKKDTTIDS
jgi:type I restriction-modification system DNA methylase subunit